MSDMRKRIERHLRGPTVWDRIGIAALYGFFGLVFIGGWVFICLAVLHMLPSDWYADV